MSPRSFQPDVVTLQCVNQKPIGLNVAVAASCKISTEWMILVMSWKSFSLPKNVENGPEFIEIISALFRELDVFLELACPTEGSHSPRSA